jgi:hypothetical protein
MEYLLEIWPRRFSTFLRWQGPFRAVRYGEWPRFGRIFGNVVCLQPPLSITAEECDRAATAVEDSLTSRYLERASRD